MMKSVRNINIKTKILIYIILSIFLSLIIEIGVFNFDKLILPKELQTKQTISLDDIIWDGFTYKDDNSMVSNSENSSFSFNYNGDYIGKLNFTYESKEDFALKIVSKEEGLYKTIEESVYNYAKSSKLKVCSINVTRDVHEIKFAIDKEDVSIKDVYVDNGLSLNSYRLLFIFTSLCLFGLIFIIRPTILKSYENLFLLISLSCGLLLIIFTPSMTTVSQDDEIHYQRSMELFTLGQVNYSASEDQMTRTFAFPNNSITSAEEHKEQNKYLNKNGELYVRTAEVSKKPQLSHLCYSFSSIAMKVGKLLNLPFMVVFKLGKIANLLVYSLMMFFSIKTMPVKKYLLFIFALIPTNISLASNFSTDPIVLSFITLGISLFIKQWMSERKITLKWLLTYIAIVSFGVLPKAIYAPVVLLPLLFNKERYEGKKQFLQFRFIIVISCVLLFLTFLLPMVSANPTTGDLRVEGSSVTGQIISMLNNLWDTILLFFNNAWKQFSNKMFGMQTFTEMGYLGMKQNNSYYAILIALIAATILKTKSERTYKIDRKVKITFLILVFIISLEIWASLYMSFNSVGNTWIQGVQGRYFIPLLFPLLLCCDIPSLKTDINEGTMQKILSLVCLFALLVCIWDFALFPFCF